MRLGATPLLLAAAIATAGCSAGQRGGGAPLNLAATTTLEDSGILAALDSAFEAARPEYRIRLITGGTGEVLQLGRRKDVDVILSHDSVAEAKMVMDGAAVSRSPVMHDAFVIVGPASDPAAIAGDSDAVDALSRIAAARAPFVSRGDDSGTNRRELQLWRAAGFDPDTFPREAGSWYIDSGNGMGAALRIAVERGAYILSDRPTWLAQAPSLRLLAEGDSRLRNVYGVTRVAGASHPEAAAAFAAWIVSPAARRLIEGFGRDRLGQPLFYPDP